MPLLHLADLALRDGDRDRARVWYEESLTLRREVGDRDGMAACLDGLAGVALAENDAENAARLLGEAAALRHAVRTPVPVAERTTHTRLVAEAKAALGEVAFAVAWAEGETASLATAPTDEPDGVDGEVREGETITVNVAS
jgi:hypothetical protein